MFRKYFLFLFGGFLCCILFFAHDASAYTISGGGNCICGNGSDVDGGSTIDACSDCTSALDDSSCDYVEYEGSVAVSNYDGTCVTIEDSDKTFDCGGNILDGDGDQNGYGVSMNSSNTSVRSCEIKDFYYGVFTYWIDNPLIIGNYLHDNTGDGIHFLPNTGDPTIAIINNRILDNEEDGIAAFISEDYATGVNISNNIVCGNEGEGGATGSCPFIYGWAGTDYQFVNDIFPESKLFLLNYIPRLIDTTYTSSQVDLVPKDNLYEIKIKEEYKEQSYIDYLHLLTIDHPPEYEVHPSHWYDYDVLYTVSKNPVAPLSCEDNLGHNCLNEITTDDNDVWKMRENDYIVLDLGDLSSAQYIKLVIDRGYAGMQISQNLDVKNADGDWVTVSPSFFSPTPTIFNVQSFTSKNVLDLTGLFLTNDYRIRIHSIDGLIFGRDYEEAVALDYIGVDTSAPRTDYTVNELDPVYANLSAGMISEYWDDKEKFEMPGYVLPQYSNPNEWLQSYDSTYRNFFNATAYGDVLSDITDDECDALNIYSCNEQIVTLPGDEITVRYSYSAPSQGMERDTVFISNGAYGAMKASFNTDIYNHWGDQEGQENVCDTAYSFADDDGEGDHHEKCKYACSASEIGSLSGLAWNDDDADGVKGASETTFGGVTIDLYDTLYNKIANTITGVDGTYSFINLDAGSYFIEVTKPSNFSYSPQGGDSVIDETSGRSDLQFVGPGESIEDINAGLNSDSAAIGGFAWTDTDKNGKIDGAETKNAGIKASLYTSSGSLVGELNTDSNGFYLFTGISSGSYYVTFDIVSGYSFTLLDQGNDDLIDSDVNSDGRTQLFTVENTLLYQMVSAGYAVTETTEPDITPPTPNDTTSETPQTTDSNNTEEVTVKLSDRLAETGAGYNVAAIVAIAFLLWSLGLFVRSKYEY